MHVRVTAAASCTWWHAALHQGRDRGGPAQRPVLRCIIRTHAAGTVRGHGAGRVRPCGAQCAVQCVLKAQGMAQLMEQHLQGGSSRQAGPGCDLTRGTAPAGRQAQGVT